MRGSRAGSRDTKQPTLLGLGGSRVVATPLMLGGWWITQTLGWGIAVKRFAWTTVELLSDMLKISRTAGGEVRTRASSFDVLDRAHPAGRRRARPSLRFDHESLRYYSGRRPQFRALGSGTR